MSERKQQKKDRPQQPCAGSKKAQSQRSGRQDAPSSPGPIDG